MKKIGTHLDATVTQVLNNTTILNRNGLLDHLQNRNIHQGLITVSNHVSAVDDPGVIAAILQPRDIVRTQVYT